jgi:hypothetical protein
MFGFPWMMPPYYGGSRSSVHEMEEWIEFLKKQEKEREEKDKKKKEEDKKKQEQSPIDKATKKELILFLLVLSPIIGPGMYFLQSWAMEAMYHQLQTLFAK